MSTYLNVRTIGIPDQGTAVTIATLAAETRIAKTENCILKNLIIKNLESVLFGDESSMSSLGNPPKTLKDSNSSYTSPSPPQTIRHSY